MCRRCFFTLPTRIEYGQFVAGGVLQHATYGNRRTRRKFVVLTSPNERRLQGDQDRGGPSIRTEMGDDSPMWSSRMASVCSASEWSKLACFISRGGAFCDGRPEDSS